MGNGMPDWDLEAWLDELRRICAERDLGRLVLALKETVFDYKSQRRPAEANRVRPGYRGGRVREPVTRAIHHLVVGRDRNAASRMLNRRGCQAKQSAPHGRFGIQT